MNVNVPAGKTVQLFDSSSECQANGVVLQSLDGNGKCFVSSERGILDGAIDPTTGNPKAGFLLQFSSAITNNPSTVILAPVSDIFYARNVGAADSVISVTPFKF